MKGHTKEISDWLSVHGVPQEDHKIILNKCSTDNDTYNRYIAITRKETTDLCKWFSTIGMSNADQQTMLNRCRENPKSYQCYLSMARNNGHQVNNAETIPDLKQTHTEERKRYLRSHGYIVEEN